MNVPKREALLGGADAAEIGDTLREGAEVDVGGQEIQAAVAALAAAAGLDQEQQRLYVDVVLSSLNEAAKRSLEAMMKGGYEYQSEFARTYVAKGRQEGRDEGLREGLQEGLLKAKAQDVLAVLEARGLEVSADVRERVLASTDLAELDRWIRRAAVVSEALQLFESTSS